MQKLKDVINKLQTQMNKDWEVLQDCKSASDMAIASIRYNTIRGVLNDLYSLEGEINVKM